MRAAAARLVVSRACDDALAPRRAVGAHAHDERFLNRMLVYSAERERAGAVESGRDRGCVCVSVSVSVRLCDSASDFAVDAGAGEQCCHMGGARAE